MGKCQDSQNIKNVLKEIAFEKTAESYKSLNPSLKEWNLKFYKIKKMCQIIAIRRMAILLNCT